MSLHSWVRPAAFAAACLGWLAGCASQTAAPMASPPPPAAATVRTQFITVRAGQSLGRIAQLYHVPVQKIIAANQLTPPYRLVAGTRLVIPVAATLPAEHVASAGADAASSAKHPEHPIVTAKAAHAAARPAGPEVIPLDDPPGQSAATAAANTASAAPQPAAASADARRAGKPREVIPLD